MKDARERYAEYLETDYWKRVSQAVKAKADFKCQLCNSPHNLQAHHRTYAHRGRELEHLEDLTCLCDSCHTRFHKPELDEFDAPKPKKAKKKKNKRRKPVVISAASVVLVTQQNCKALKMTKESWRWFHENGINPKKGGWMQRAVGCTVPAHWFGVRPAPVAPPEVGGGLARSESYRRIVASLPN